MALYDPGSIAATLARLLQGQTNRVQHLGSQFGRQFQNTLPQISGPFGSSSSNGGMRGASPNLGQTLNQFGRQAGSQSSTLGNILGTIAGGLNQQQDPLMSLYEQLLGQLQQPVNQPSAIDTDSLMQQVQDALNPLYDQRAASAKSEANRGTKDVKEMYRALSNDYERLAPEQIAQSDAAKQQIEDLYGELRSNINGDYARVSKEQGDLFKQLGIESALPEVLDQQAAPVQDASIAASENEAQQQQRYMDIGQMDSTYMREGSPLATMTGNEVSSNLLAQLQNYLQQNEAERTSGIQSSYMDQLGQAQSQLMQQQQMAQSETGRRQEMLWQMLQGQLQGNSSASLTPDSFMGSLPGNVQQSVANAFTSLERSPEAVYGKVQDPRNPVPGTFVETTPEWYMAQADQMLQQGQIDPATHQALLMYLQLYFKSGQ